jgi:uncharacterized membrane protein
MTPSTLRVIGIVFLVAAAAVAVLNLRRVAGLGAIALPSVLTVLGVAFILRARKRRL